MLNNKKKTFEQHDNESVSYYFHSILKPNLFSNLQENLNVDICVIGGGLTGVTSALNLAKNGYKVALLEARKLGWGASGRNGGQLSFGLRRNQIYIEKLLGVNHAKELWNLGLEAVQDVKDYISTYKIECGIQKGVMYAGYYKRDYIAFLNEIEHMQKNYDFNNFEYFDTRQIHEQINSKKYYSGLLNKSAYHLNPLKFLNGLVKELINLKVKIFEHSPAEKIEENHSGVNIFTKHNTIKAKFAVVGCNGYLDNLLGKVSNKYMPINNYIVATEPIGEEKARKFIRNNYAVSDTRFIIDYYRFSEDWRMVFGGGETYTSNFLQDAKYSVSKRIHFSSLLVQDNFP